jgi:hypothetical protein
MKLNEFKKTQQSHSKPALKKSLDSSKKNRLNDPFNSGNRKRKFDEMENDSNEAKFTYKYKEGYVNAVKRNVPFEFFLQ